jgi:hypothetical protein
MSEEMEQQIKHLNQQASQLYEERQFEQAIPVAREICN